MLAYQRSLVTVQNIRTQLESIVTKQGFPCVSKRASRAIADRVLDIDTCQSVRRAFSAGLFGCAARRVVGQTSFVTKQVHYLIVGMRGHGSVVHLHPGSVLHGQESRLDWVVYGYIQTTSRVDVHRLDNCGRLSELKTPQDTNSKEHNATVVDGMK
ncbi:hypothetical protein SARC_09964 [Sphaeroforma arctica JP610]|uniref:DEAD-box helicase OB fold domain-containing protein n=1 Tax=Sphaeroforma arctica JP610 TaxID=667725 RepID=A0A0L0FLC7_9EUKA|nr:hypothetical protein SARC_09964 [Sphaeroforma arctica JP610]KNC77577.1 hypothetical protein SARC_09964 [Sphaeroforma arctica JP610]|eukprot:XP_014151479.1 hypothetical protein SARC_09964 [Sphaeroforma arctica JP610]